MRRLLVGLVGSGVAIGIVVTLLAIWTRDERWGSTAVLVWALVWASLIVTVLVWDELD